MNDKQAECDSMLLSGEICRQPKGHDGPCGDYQATIGLNTSQNLYVVDSHISVIDTSPDPHRILKEALFALIELGVGDTQYGGVDVGNGKKAFIRFTVEDDEKPEAAT